MLRALHTGAWLAVLTSLSPAAPPPDADADADAARGGALDLAQALTDLRADSAELRRQAGRWIGIHAEPAQFALLAEAAASGDAEVRTRLARALGSDDRHLALAALFFEEERPALRELGETAVAELLLRWNPRLGAELVGGDELAERVAKWNEELPLQMLALPPEASLERALELLRRFGPLPVPVAIDPRVDAGQKIGEPRQRPGLELRPGTWSELLVELAGRGGYRLEGYGLGDEGPGGFLRIGPPRVLAGSEPESGLTAPLRWCRELQVEREPERRRRAARALAGCSWPAAMHWLEERWLERSDEAALEGLVLAAAAGRVVPAMTRRDVFEDLFTRGLAAVAESSGSSAAPGAARFAERLAAALGSVGPIAADGSELGERVLRGWEAATPRELWWRLSVLERMGGTSAVADRVLTTLLAAPAGGRPPQIAEQALRAWLRRPAAGLTPLRELGDPEGLIGWPTDWAGTRELAGMLARSGAAPPEAWRAPADVPVSSDLRARLVVFEWFLGRGEVETAAEHLLSLGVAGGVWPTLPTQPAALDATAEELEFWREAAGRHLRQDRVAEILCDWNGQGRPDLVFEVLELAGRRLTGGPALMLDRLCALAGTLEEGRAEALADYVIRSAGTDVVALGALGGIGPRQDARLQLRRLLQFALDDDLEDAWEDALATGIERSIGDLFALGQDAMGRQMERQIRSVARGRPTHRLALRISDSRWPPAPRSRHVDLARRARSLDDVF